MINSIFADFESAGKNAGTDKILYHGYHRFYPYFFSHMRDSKISLLEIGLDANASVKLWKDYFSKVTIYGVDIEDKKAIEGVIFFKGDQSKIEDLIRIKNQIPETLNIIIDDGSHVPEHQMLTFNLLWDKLKGGGAYIIEDIETSFWDYGKIYGYNVRGGIKNVKTPFNQFLMAASSVNAEFKNNNYPSVNMLIDKSILQTIEMVSFAYNSIIIIKKDKQWDKFYGREYRLDSMRQTSWHYYKQKIFNMLNWFKK